MLLMTTVRSTPSPSVNAIVRALRRKLTTPPCTEHTELSAPRWPRRATVMNGVLSCAQTCMRYIDNVQGTSAVVWTGAPPLPWRKRNLPAATTHHMKRARPSSNRNSLQNGQACQVGKLTTPKSIIDWPYFSVCIDTLKIKSKSHPSPSCEIFALAT